jgi:hypothetical protein
MEQWEYLPTFIEANAKSQESKDFLKTQNPDVKKPPRYMVEAMMPQLNELGAQGWELVHMEPVAGVGKKGDVLFADHKWSNTYFCVFKRRKAVQPAQHPQQATPQAQG